MIETAAARALVGRLLEAEDRLGRLLTSGWRQSSTEAADLRRDAESLAEDGLTGVAGRLAAVAEASDAVEALSAIALASSACRLLRLRLLAGEAPEGWVPLMPPRSKPEAGSDTLLPIARLLLDGSEVWACARPTRGQWLLLEPPFPVEQQSTREAAPPEPTGIFGRLRRQIDRALGGEQVRRSPWMQHVLRGRLVWKTRHPLGANNDVTICRLEHAEWDTEPDLNQLGIRAFYQTLNGRILVSGATVFPMGGGFRLLELERDDPAALVWLDETAAAAFGAAATPKVWTISWTDGKAVMPVAIVTRGDPNRAARLTHLIPGSPEDVLIS
jgi:hypothetical protein